MLILYIYLFILLLICFLTYVGFTLNVRFSPIKIKVLCFIALIMISLRITALLIMFYSENLIFLYLLKPFAFLNLLYIPIITIICLYIFIRNDKINFSNSFIVCGVLAFIYTFVIYKVPTVIQSMPGYGYSMNFKDNLYVLYGFIALNTITLVFSIIQLGKPIINNVGVFLVLLSSVFCITDILLVMLGYDYFSQNIFGDLLFVVTLNYAISRLKN